jgi:cytochrome c oxidase subunit 3
MSLVTQDVLPALSRFDVRPPGGGAPGEGPRSSSDFDTARFGVWVLLGTIAMLFIGFTSALVFRRASSDWVPMTAPGLLWVNTSVLALSSVALEMARRALRGLRYEGVRPWIAATGSLGALFVGGQLLAWRELAAQGVFLSSDPHSSFFYLLTGVHVVHVLAALVWFSVVFVRVQRRYYAPGGDGLGRFAIFWHFLGALWFYLLFVLFVL